MLTIVQFTLGVMANILIAEDNKEFADLLMRYLLSAGHTVRVVNEGVRVMEEVHRQSPDIILLDFLIPAGRGSEIIKRLKGHRDTVRIPIVIISALNEAKARDQGYEGGAYIYLTKPFALQDLLGYIEEAVDSSSVTMS